MTIFVISRDPRILQCAEFRRKCRKRWKSQKDADFLQIEQKHVNLFYFAVLASKINDIWTTVDLFHSNACHSSSIGLLPWLHRVRNAWLPLHRRNAVVPILSVSGKHPPITHVTVFSHQIWPWDRSIREHVACTDWLSHIQFQSEIKNIALSLVSSCFCYSFWSSVCRLRQLQQIRR